MLPPAHLMSQTASVNLLNWYRAHQRQLPWRQNRDPYRIWISEVMLQQTTVTAVIPYYYRFLAAFPTLEDLAKAPIESVLEKWAGLGYYSRARNLHKAAQKLYELGAFPRTYTELLQLPGFGPYTARAVSSLAFGEPVGVLDGNVIRVLSRYHGIDLEWWRPAERQTLQNHADQWAQQGPSHEINQALMELGATICTPQKPSCLLCPWMATCEARKQDRIESLPKPKQRPAKEIWLWRPVLVFEGRGPKNKSGTRATQNTSGSPTKIYLGYNKKAPVLSNQLLPPGEFRQLKTKPRTFDLRHNITHHDIFIEVRLAKKSEIGKLISSDGEWVRLSDVAKVTPFSLVRKVLDYALETTTSKTTQSISTRDRSRLSRPRGGGQRRMPRAAGRGSSRQRTGEAKRL